MEGQINLQTLTPKNPIKTYNMKSYSGYAFIKETDNSLNKEIFESIEFLEGKMLLLDSLKKSKTDKFTMEQARLLSLIHKHCYDAFHSAVYLGEKLEIVNFLPNYQGDTCNTHSKGD